MNIIVLCNHTDCKHNKKEWFVHYGDQAICSRSSITLYDTKDKKVCLNYHKINHLTTHDLLEIDEANDERITDMDYLNDGSGLAQLREDAEKKVKELYDLRCNNCGNMFKSTNLSDTLCPLCYI